jgi:hypothetical protein
LVAIVATSAFVSDRQEAQADPTSSIVIQGNTCVALLAAGAALADDQNNLLFACLNPVSTGGSGAFFYGPAEPPNLDIMAAAASQRNDRHDTFDAPAGFEDCNNVLDPDTGEPAVDDLNELLCSLDNRDGEIDGQFRITRDDFAGIDLDLNHLHDQDGRLAIIGFFNDDTLDTAFRTDVGKFETVASTYVCSESTIDQDSNAPGVQIDEDCDGDGIPGDGAVVAHLQATGISNPAADPEPRGPAGVRIAQEGIALVETITVVGEPDELQIQEFENTIMNGLEQEDCPLGGDADAFVEALGRPDKTIALSKVLDSDGTEITGAFLSFSTDEPETLLIASGLSASLDLGAFGAGGPNIFCGGDETGPTVLTVNLLSAAELAAELGISPERDSDSETETMEILVVGQPGSVTLTADPATLNCDGTASSTVSAAVTHTTGETAVNGVEVDFSVQVLGVANPLTATTTDGVAKSTITPLATDEAVGVPVVVTAGDVTSSILVNCSPTAGPVPTPPGGGAGPGGTPPGGTISPPDTGTGGDIDGQGALNVWAAIGPFVGALGLVGARLALRRM